MIRGLLLSLGLLLASGGMAFAQSVPPLPEHRYRINLGQPGAGEQHRYSLGSAPGWVYGYVPSAGEWNNAFASKQNYFGTPGTLATLSGLAGLDASGSTVLPTGGNTARTLAAYFADTVNVIDRGADPSGVADSAPAFRAALASNRRIVVPPGTYLFASTQTAPCCAFDSPAVLAQSLSNFEIDGYGATITVANGIALSSAFQFDRDSHFSMRGLTIIGNRTGLTASQENSALTLSSDVDFRVEDIRATGFGGNGAAVDGDWLVDGTFSKLQMDGVGHCFDMAYLLHVRFLYTNAKGADTNGASGSGQVGQTCLSVIVDTPNAAQNNTGTSFTETDDVSVSGIEESNFDTGMLIETGTHYDLSGNNWHDNPGSGSNPGLGVYVHYNASSSTGAPPHGINIRDRFYNNGASVAGYGLFISAGGISNGDTMPSIGVVGSQFDNNANTGINTDTTSSVLLPGLTITGDTFSGSAQTTSVGTSALSAMTAPHPYYNGSAWVP